MTPTVTANGLDARLPDQISFRNLVRMRPWIHPRIVKPRRHMSRLTTSHAFTALFTVLTLAFAGGLVADPAGPAPLGALLRETSALTVDQSATRLRAYLQDQPEAYTEHYLLGLALLDKLDKLKIAAKPAGPRAAPAAPAPPASPEAQGLPGPNPAVSLAPDLAATVGVCCAALAASPDWRNRLVAADLLAWTGWTLPPPEAANLIRDEFWPIRERAIRGLGFLPAGVNLELLSDLASHARGDSWRERTEAAKALGELGAADRLLPLLEDPEPEVRLTAAYQFLRWPNPGPTAEKALRKAADRETSPKVRAELDRALKRAQPRYPVPTGGL
jgi:hypothetical protein